MLSGWKQQLVAESNNRWLRICFVSTLLGTRIPTDILGDRLGYKIAKCHGDCCQLLLRHHGRSPWPVGCSILLAQTWSCSAAPYFLDGGVGWFWLVFPQETFSVCQVSRFYPAVLYFVFSDVSPDVSTDVKSSRVAAANHKVFRKPSIFNILAYLHNLCSICLQKL